MDGFERVDYFLADEDATQLFGAALAQALLAQEIFQSKILLEGDLGAGKTTLSRGLLRALGHQGPVPSPTYTLVEPYSLSSRTFYHLDLYRLADADELEFLGWRDMQEAIMLIEWPERAATAIGQGDVRLALTPSGDGRQLSLQAHSDDGQRLVSAVGPIWRASAPS